MLRGAGIVALVVLAAACGQSSVASKVTPSVPAVQATWNQDLSLTGEVSGHMSGIVADVGTQNSACTGLKPRPGQTWSDKFYGTIDTSGTVWGIDFVIQNFGGPGTYSSAAVAVQVHNADNSKVWQNTSSADKVVFTLDRSGQSGTIDALLTNADSGKAGAVHLTGGWNCKA